MTRSDCTESAEEPNQGETIRRMGLPCRLTQDPFADAMSHGEALFRTFLEQKDMDGLVGGVPTAASLAGVSHRFKRRKGTPGRPSFVDTGQFSAAFKMWADRN